MGSSGDGIAGLVSGQRAKAGGYRAAGEHCRKGKEGRIGRHGMPAQLSRQRQLRWSGLPSGNGLIE